jgi:hypothetical protein
MFFISYVKVYTKHLYKITRYESFYITKTMVTPIFKMFFSIFIQYIDFKFSRYVYQCFKYKNVRYTKLCNGFKYFGIGLQNYTLSQDHFFMPLNCKYND